MNTNRSPVFQGREADLYALGNGWLARCAKDPEDNCELMASAMEYAREHGYPVPRVRRARGPMIVMERVEGPTMFEEILKQPRLIQSHLARLAELHDQLHEIPGPEWLEQKFGTGSSLIHLDLHPFNVIMSNRGPVVVDWSAVATGPSGADLAQTWVVLTSTFDRSHVAPFERSASVFARCVDTKQLQEWVLPIVERRLREAKVLPNEIEALEHIRKSHLTASMAPGGAGRRDPL